MNATESAEITAYVEGVRRALAGLAESTRLDLLEDLPEHLAEVQAEGIGTLVERLGTPEAYAMELLATAGLVGGFPDPPPNRFAALLEARDNALRLLGRADVRVGPVIGYEKASDFLVLLRPAWWVLRGYLAAMLIAYLVDGDGQSMGLLPRISGNELIALVLLGGCVIVSILLGRRTLTRWPRYALWSGTVVLALFALGGFATADSEARYPSYNPTSDYTDNPFSYVNDVFVYDGQGRLVSGARLYDQDGNPIQLGSNYCMLDPASGEVTRSRALGYPFCPENAPFGASPPASAFPTSPASPASSAGAPTSPASSAGAPTSPAGAPGAPQPAATSAAPAPSSPQSSPASAGPAAAPTASASPSR